jgi:hypothetical protein
MDAEEHERTRAMDEDMFRDTKLYIRPGKSENDYVTTVRVLVMDPPPDAIFWGERLFIRLQDGRYVEGFSYMATHEAAR